MKIIINQLRNNSRKDLVRLMIYDLKSDKWFNAFVLICLVVFMINFLNNLKILSLKPEIFKMLSSTLGVGLLAMLIYTAIHALKSLKRINNQAKVLQEGEMAIKFTDDGVSVQTNSYGDSYSLEWNEVKELLVIKETIFLIPVYKDGLLIRINKKEIIQGDFDKVLLFIKKCILK